jgi:hypothetical protein
VSGSTKPPLERLQEAGQLTLIRSAWCAPEPGRPGEWYQVLAVTDGLQLVRDELATIGRERGRQVLRPA